MRKNVKYLKKAELQMFIVITLNIPKWRLQKGVTNIVIPVL